MDANHAAAEHCDVPLLGKDGDRDSSVKNKTAKRTYNTSGLKRRKRKLGRHRKGKQKRTSFDFTASREAIGKPNANAQEIAAALNSQDAPSTDAPPPIMNPRSPSKKAVKRERNKLRKALNNLQSCYDR